MRRKPKQKELSYWSTLRPCFPIFKAKQCYNCDHYFQFEKGWKWCTDLSLARQIGYLCSVCASTRQQAITVLSWQKTEKV